MQVLQNFGASETKCNRPRMAGIERARGKICTPEN
jgi:hypothetical protein